MKLTGDEFVKKMVAAKAAKKAARKELTATLAKETGIPPATAEAELIAEEWIYDDAKFNILNSPLF